MKIWMLITLAQLIATAAYAQSIKNDVADVGDRFFLREEAVDLLFSDHGDLGRSFSCTGGRGFVAQEAGSYNGLCIFSEGDYEVYSVEAITWPRSSELQVVTVCNHSIIDPQHNIPLEFLRTNEVKSGTWSQEGRAIGKVRYLGHTGGWLSNKFDNVLLDGDIFGVQAVCWRVKKTKQ